MTEVDQIVLDAVDQARAAAEEAAGDFGVGDYLGVRSEDGVRQGTHYFACPHPAYTGWHWAVTMTRAARARQATVNEVVLLPSDGSLLAPPWVPWADRLQAGDLTPGALLPTPDNDPRLEPGYTGGELAPDADPAEWSQTRAVVTELGLGRERLLSPVGREQAAERWLSGEGGPDTPVARQAPGVCVACGYFVRLTGSLGRVFGVCANEYSSSDGSVVSVDHGCGGHSDVVADERGIRLPEPVFDTVSLDHSLFD
ncbi:DUF3027 domain-containing protein [Brooklawnia cerclae]|uniref:DUF3027 domain-containing protein n=1 Tax=Brooklawnia cerclae TaxID=349934 RepID=A0ABX0SMM7_9ACTN|nr:DUF3027 domain-containing protein [Brooklawnia cerclae]NIH58016.1 hypothetical protein [Brooklawnia cerclae]